MAKKDAKKHGNNTSDVKNGNGDSTPEPYEDGNPILNVNMVDDDHDIQWAPSADGYKKVVMWPEGSTIKARPIQEPLAVAEPSLLFGEITSYIMDKGAPGIRVIELSGGRLNNEALAIMLRGTDFRKKFVTMLQMQGGTVTSTVIRALAPGRDGILHNGTVLYTAQFISEKVDIALTSLRFDLSSKERKYACSIFTEIISRALLPTRAVVNTMPTIEVIERTRRFPLFQDLVEGVVEAEITRIFDQMETDYTKLTTAKRFKLDLIAQEIERDLRGLALLLKAVDIIEPYMKDTRALVKMYLTQSPALAGYPLELQTNANLLSLSQCLTWVLASMETGVQLDLTAENYQLDDVLSKVATWLRAGPRFETRQLKELSRYYSHYVITNERARSVYAVGWSNHDYCGDLQAYNFMTSGLRGQQLHYPWELPAVQATLESAIAPADRLVTSGKIANFVISALSMSTTTSDPTTEPKVATVLMTDLELVYYAASLADRIAVGETATNDGEKTLALIYEAPWIAKNYTPMRGVNGATVATTDPAELLFLTEPSEVQEPFPRRTSLIPKDYKGQFVLTVPPSDFMSRISSDFKFANLRVGGVPHDLKINFNRLMGLATQLDTYVMVDQTSVALWGAQFAAYALATNIGKTFGGQREDGRSNYDISGLEEQAATNFMNMIIEISSTPTIIRMTRSILTNLRLDLANVDDGAYQSAFFQRALQMEIRTITTLALLSRLGYASWNDMNTLYEFLMKKEVFARYTSTTTM